MTRGAGISSKLARWVCNGDFSHTHTCRSHTIPQPSEIPIQSVRMSWLRGTRVPQRCSHRPFPPPLISSLPIPQHTLRRVADRIQSLGVSRQVADVRASARLLRIERRAEQLKAEHRREVADVLIAVVKLQASFRWVCVAVFVNTRQSPPQLLFSSPRHTRFMHPDPNPEPDP